MSRAAVVPAIKTGDIIELGPHRLMCGDSTNPAHVAALMRDARPQMVFCSPPYLQQRDYDSAGSHTWDALMQATFSGLPTSANAQVFVNLGLVHRKHQWTAYWHNWTLWMAEQGWLRLGWYVWDKMAGLPTWPGHGRLYPCHEFIFHFARSIRRPNKTIKCTSRGRTQAAITLRDKNGLDRRIKATPHTIHPERIADTVTRISARGQPITGHPASFPVGLPGAYIDSYSSPGEIVYDPFLGGGTTIMAAQLSGRIGFGMEKSARYCEMAAARYCKHQNGRRSSSERC